MNALLRQTLSPSRRECGSLNVKIAGQPCVLRCSGGLWVPEYRTLVVADLHLEKGSAYAARGQMLPPYDSRVTLERLQAEMQNLRPDQVVLLGDSFHDRGSIARLSQADRDQVGFLAERCGWVWLTGNHDREALERRVDGEWILPGAVVDTMTLGALRLVHEPGPGPQPGEVAGHLHPCAKIAAHNRSVRRPCFVTDGQRIILPAFGAYTGGLNVTDPAIAGLFQTPPLAAALGRDKVHPLAWGTLR